MADNVYVVKEILEKAFKKGAVIELLNRRISHEGFVECGIPMGCTSLIVAMIFARPQTVSLLLEYGADPKCVDAGGIDGFVHGVRAGSLDSARVWIKCVKTFNVNTLLRGSTCIAECVRFGSINATSSVKFLIDECNADPSILVKDGSSALLVACGNEDASLELIMLLLQVSPAHFLNTPRRSPSLKYRIFQWCAKKLVSFNLTSSTIAKDMSKCAGHLALHAAVQRGDYDIVRLLLKNGANPNVENDHGLNAIEICKRDGPFPEILGMLRKCVQKKSSTVSSNSKRLMQHMTSKSILDDTFPHGSTPSDEEWFSDDSVYLNKTPTLESVAS